MWTYTLHIQESYNNLKWGVAFKRGEGLRKQYETEKWNIGAEWAKWDEQYKCDDVKNS